MSAPSLPRWHRWASKVTGCRPFTLQPGRSRPNSRMQCKSCCISGTHRGSARWPVSLFDRTPATCPCGPRLGVKFIQVREANFCSNGRVAIGSRPRTWPSECVPVRCHTRRLPPSAPARCRAGQGGGQEGSSTGREGGRQGSREGGQGGSDKGSGTPAGSPAGQRRGSGHADGSAREPTGGQLARQQRRRPVGTLGLMQGEGRSRRSEERKKPPRPAP